jgi:hypothetical protein
MMAHMSISQPTREYGIENNVARFADKASSISYTQKTEYNVEAQRLRGIPN